MKKVLFTATVDSHILNFHIPYLKWFKELGYEVHVASNGTSAISYVDVKYNISFQRSPYKRENYIAYKQLKKIIVENNYDLIHCHTPIGSVLTRLAARKIRNKGTKVLYTAHGFHFYKGAPLINWILYYPIEKWLARYTDCLITMNKEDYQMVNNFKAKTIEFVNGVGIDLNRFMQQTIKKKSDLRKEYNYKNEDYILIYAAELNYNKHQDLLINVVKLLKDKIPRIKLLLAGSGSFSERYRKQVKKFGLTENVQFLGQRSDIVNLMLISDLAVSASRREGLPVNVMEAMATGLPLVVTDCRGNRDLVNNGENGYIVGIDDVKGFANAIEELYLSAEKRQRFGKKGLELVRSYSLDKVRAEMEEIYSHYLQKKGNRHNSRNAGKLGLITIDGVAEK